ncbi:hypothetical protein J2Z32_003447 [Paenibacillus turicensis]|uniref:Uncharacterized protein n=1 Tax=Paenibacillus turicensis TaxID=160487 RepID=A0ABS4FW18_9BACL|nr:hypothetical protein [Paenibacillus turicensis]
MYYIKLSWDVPNDDLLKLFVRSLVIEMTIEYPCKVEVETPSYKKLYEFII